MNIITSSWDNYLDYFPVDNKDIYFTEGYVKLYEDNNNVAKSFVYQKHTNYMLFPYLERTFEYKGNILKDFETAYGYGGPIFNTENVEFRQEALMQMYKNLQENNYVAGFVRFHPLLNNYLDVNIIGTILKDRYTVGMDLSLTEDDIWQKELHTKNRNCIKKAIKHNLSFFVDEEFTYIDKFIQLYDDTMDKLSATDFFYFDKNYYMSLKKNCPKSFIGGVKNGDKIISMAIFMIYNKFSHYHLSGSDKTQLNLAPNNFMLYNAALELKRRKATIFHLGGGTTSLEEDPLFGFKKRFSKHLYQFYIGKIIFNNAMYTDLCDDWKKRNKDKMKLFQDYFLKYKC